MPQLPDRITLGTRGSPLAMLQTHEVRNKLTAAHPGLTVEIVEISVAGDRIQDRALAEVGGKGLFTKELDKAILDGRCDAAVHSMKDVETWLADGISLTCVLEREDVRDVFLSPKAATLMELPEGARLGTSSLRRKAQILAKRPDLEVVLFRGNVQTRLRKLDEGVADGTLLALAGLNRLDMAHVATEVLSPDFLLPAVAQGAIGVTVGAARDDLATLFAPLNHPESESRVLMERAFLDVMDGTCHTPIAGLSEIHGDRFAFRGLVAREDGTRVLETACDGPLDQAETLVRGVAQALKQEMGDRFFD
ncbi:hydroxymethylbilane synthase [Rhodospirillaceae bacterium KN72]|uniref:Porphobilinogen deaminase n=1 Tax=Pacificispira spongiicola TaxID=2729598 RepID=A0A7Y0DY63_9PROT|nr:hydroxymethylbilane synthase [Pacificispira spongiicola]NMM43767.1 hydroxymethylbilane synthase [Pacificispira spongiicola]